METTTKPKLNYTSTSITAADGYPLAASIFEPEIPNGKTAVFGSATGCLQGYYYNLAGYLQEQGFRAITFDYRGIGLSRQGSLKSFKASAQDWGELDLEAVFQYVLNEYPNDELQFISHSIGGQIFGLAASSSQVKKVAMIASQSGYWNFWPGHKKLGMWMISHVFIPTTTALIGYLPAKRMGLFEDLPKGVARQWARWIRNKDYMFVDPMPSLANLDKVTALMRCYSFSDDPSAPKKTVDWLASKFTNAQVERLHYTPQQFELKEIGHFGFFRSKYKPYFWEDLVAFLRD